MYLLKKNRIFFMGIVALVLAISSFVIGTSCDNKQINEDIVPLPDRSFHEEVDATTGPTLLWTKQIDFQNINVSGDEGFAIIYPFQNSVFPADISPASFIWKPAEKEGGKWHVSFSVEGFSYKTTTKGTRLKPDDNLWEELKKESKNRDINFTVKNKNIEKKLVFRFSKDSVNSPIFYRAIPLPFSYANKYKDRIKWYLGDLSTNRKRVMLENMPVCANCHSFTKDGSILAMDVDYGNDKGNYAITNIERETPIGLKNIVSWSDYKKEDGVMTFGLLAKISPDGKYAISTVKDKSIFVPVDLSFWYSQLFFPVKGLLVCYDVLNKKFFELEGACNPGYVQSSPAWAPDMGNVVFSRAAYNKDTSLEAQENVVLDMRFATDYIHRKKEFKFDLYRIPWNEGKGGTPVAIDGASGNGQSNYFARYSPDGKWIVFCKAENFMLLQSDSKLYIMPAKGGEPRLMNCNTNEMNSWHSFSPNGKWMVFSTKYFGPYTQLFLTHIDENGNDTPPIWLEQLTVDMKAVNIPEFVKTNYDGWCSIKDDFTYTEKYASTVAEHNYNTKDLTTIVEEAEQQIAANPGDYYGHYLKAVMLSEKGDNALALKSARQCIGIIEGLPAKGFKEYGDLGLAYFIANNPAKAIEMSSKAVEIKPDYLFAWMTLGDIYYRQRDYENTNEVYTRIIELNNSVDYRLKKAELNMRVNNYGKAVKELEFILKSEDCNTIALQMLVNCCSALNDLANVEKFCSKLIGCNPNVGYFSRGNYYLHTGKNKKAVDDFTEGLKYKKDDQRALFLRAQAYLELKNYEKALTDLQKVKSLLLSTPENQRQLDIKKTDEMIERCEEFINYK